MCTYVHKTWLNKIKMLIKGMEEEFHKKIKVLKTNQTKILEMENVNEMKNKIKFKSFMENFTNRVKTLSESRQNILA